VGFFDDQPEMGVIVSVRKICRSAALRIARSREFHGRVTRTIEEQTWRFGPDFPANDELPQATKAQKKPEPDAGQDQPASVPRHWVMSPFANEPSPISAVRASEPTLGTGARARPNSVVDPNYPASATDRDADFEGGCRSRTA
jgi:hypothetical protein